MRCDAGRCGNLVGRVARQPERRRGAEAIVAAIVSGIRGHGAGVGLRGLFEDAVGSVVPVVSVRLCSPGEHERLAAAPGGEDSVIRIPVRSCPGSEPAVLELHADPARPLDAWDRQVVARSAQLATLVLEVERTHAWRELGRRPFRGEDGAAPLIGSSRGMRLLREKIERVAATDFTVLVEGESGSGKELVAHQIHDLSRRRRGPFVAINCAALVESLLEAELFGIEDRTATGVRGRRGKFEHATGGTLFLDEVADLSLSAQAKLLRAIQECAVERVGGHQTYHVDIRLVVATNRRLTELVDHGLFRHDLYYRLSGIDLRVPALRTRREDILELATYFLDRHAAVRHLSLSPPASDALLTYDWPGNVRELERLMEGAVALVTGTRIEVDDLPAAVRGRFSDALLPALEQGDTLRCWGGRYARLVYERCGRSKREACRVLGISYHTLQGYLAQSAFGSEADYASSKPPEDGGAVPPAAGAVGLAWPEESATMAHPAVAACAEGPPEP